LVAACALAASAWARGENKMKEGDLMLEIYIGRKKRDMVVARARHSHAGTLSPL
jgi:hypothetical protein